MLRGDLEMVPRGTSAARFCRRTWPILILGLISIVAVRVALAST